MITAERLRSLVHYEPATGIFLALVRRGPCMPGKQLGTPGSCRARGKQYMQIRIGDRRYYAHRLAWLYVYGEWPGIIDHIDRNGLNNRIANLREATPRQNQANRDSSNPNGRGVSLVSSGRFEARIKTCGKTYFLGSFSTAAEARAAYIGAALVLHGRFASRRPKPSVSPKLRPAINGRTPTFTPTL